MAEGTTPAHWDEVLQKCLTDLKAKFPKASEAQIAERIKIPRATLNRLYNESKRPQLDTLLKLIVSSGNIGLLDRAIASFDDKWAKTLKGILTVAMTEKNPNFTTEELEESLYDRDAFVAYLMASMKTGCDKSQVIDALGTKGLEAMNTLIRKGIVREDNGQFFTNDDRVLVRSFEHIKHHLPTYMGFYRTEHVGQERNYTHSLSEGMNTYGIKAVQDAHRRFHAELKEIMRNQEFHGNIPMFSVAVCDTFTSIKNDNHGEDLQ